VRISALRNQENDYPLPYLKRLPFQPFVFVEGKFGVGVFAEKARIDAGYGLGAGVDIKIGKKSGFSIIAELHGATETAQRFYIGYFSQ